MTGERKSKAKALFIEALDLPRTERRAFLEHRCPSDAPLVEEVLSLLEAHEGATGFMAEPALASGAGPASSDAPTFDPEAALEHPETVGAYRILEVLGEGGMGTVYLAEQTEPVQRKVALKVIKLGMSTREVVARFDLERQALAMMSHSGIAKVFDAGTSERGQPFFVMEYVGGQPITRISDERRLGTKERLRLFMHVCEAIQHAHQKGIILRDIKPSNVLIAEEEGRLVPKIIDFGVARATDRSAALRNAFTVMGTFVGTPEYMSPEQAVPGGLDIDTRTDIYSLGVLLYELLTGELPFGFGEQNSASYSEIQHRIREEDPPRPSQRLSSLGRKVSEIAALRRTVPKLLKRQLQGELDWITMRAMEKDRNRRYGTALELAADVARHLRGEAVTAGPPSAMYLLRKGMSRHRKAVATLAIFFVTLLVGLSVVLSMYFEKEAAEEVARARVEDYQNLKDVVVIEELERRTETLWPARADRVWALEAWLAEARALVARGDGYRRKLVDMREQALPYSDEDRRDDRENHPLAGELASLKILLAQWDDHLARSEKGLQAEDYDDRAEFEQITTKGVKQEEYRQELLRRIARLEGQRRARRTWRFTDPQDQWFHSRLTELVESLDRFGDPETGIMADVERRIAEALTTETLTIDDNEVAWSRAIASIADPLQCPSYEGLVLSPQSGLIPLERDPASGLWEFYVEQTGSRPRRGADGRYEIAGATAMVLVLLPGGTFYLGASPVLPDRPGLPNQDPGAYYREGPTHRITLSPFFLSKYEMTQGQWFRLNGNFPSRYPTPLDEMDDEARDRLPVDSVSWTDCRTVLSRVGLTFPTEAQWEYAARGGTGWIRYTGDDPRRVVGHVNILDQDAMSTAEAQGQEVPPWLFDGSTYQAPVGHYEPNPFGLHDVMGNVYEWCLDDFDSYFCPVRPDTGERIADPAGGSRRICRGGSFKVRIGALRLALRVDHDPDRRAPGLGVRPAMELLPGKPVDRDYWKPIVWDD